ncbi:MAG: V-type ATP synthase subunit E family protein [Candidatus Thermoplasmatota archaeon]|uniref:V-type proton ATPase subunit E n=1 Tax=marine metagenome TaxID=408172 RepID=A0A381RF17_9ZZZZ|nr:V-type ATP synthase subunit E family protein [Candidatus Thermoplasmatota archaeon]
MTLDALAIEIDKAADEEAKAITDAAKAKAEDIVAEAERKLKSLRSDIISKAERECSQIKTEMVASARQANQKSILIARREELDATKVSVREMVGSANLKGRSALLKSLVTEARGDAKAESARSKKGDAKMILRPVGVDRPALEKSKPKKGEDDFEVGDDIDGLGGFVLEAPDGSVVLDYRFDALLEQSWTKALPAVTSALFGEN